MKEKETRKIIFYFALISLATLVCLILMLKAQNEEQKQLRASVIIQEMQKNELEKERDESNHSKDTDASIEPVAPLDETETIDFTNPQWEGPVLTREAGAIQGPSGKETYYNLPMQGVVSIMRNLGFDEENYPYWVREDGCKMLGPYVMCAANLQVRPRGSVVQSSLGEALVCDTGGFAYNNSYQLDIATSW